MLVLGHSDGGHENERRRWQARLHMHALVWIAVAFLIAIFVVIALGRLAIDIICTHDSPE